MASNVAVALLAVAGAAYTGIGILHANPFEDEVTITVELAETGGVFDRSEVTYRGKQVGSVVEVVPRRGGVQVAVSIDSDVSIPVDTRVVVSGLSAVGEQTLDFRPRTSGGPFLEDGDVVPESATTIPVGFPALIQSVSGLVSQLDAGAVRTLVDELYVGVGGAGPELRRAISDASTLLATLRAVTPETRSLLRNGESALTSIDAMSANLEAFATSAARLTTSVRSGEGLYVELLEASPGLIESTTKNVTAIAGPTFRLLDDATVALGVLSARMPAFEALLTWLPLGAGVVSNAFHDGVLNAVGDFLPSQLCDYGTPMRTPWEAHDDAPDLSRSCSERAPDLQQRGSSNAPR